MKNFFTACTMDCPDACGLVVEQRPDGGVRLRGGPQNPFTAGFLCAKIKGHPERLKAPERIVRPLLRKGESWQPISWESALDLCAEKIQQLRSAPQSILHIHSDGAKGVLKEAPTLFFTLLGSSRIKGSLCDAAGYIAFIHDFGSRINHDPADLLNAAAIVNWGKDLARSSVHTAAIVRQARKNGARVLAISPGGDGNGPFSDDRILIRPGTDRFLAAAVIRMLQDKGRTAPDLLSRAHNSERFLSEIMNHPVPELLAQCEVTPADARMLFEYYADSHPTATFIGAGLQRYRYGGENVRFINALAYLSGNIGVNGGGSYFHSHSYGNLNLKWIRPAAGVPRRALPVATIGREILAARHPPIRLIWVNGINVINQAPGMAETIEAFEQVDFIVAVEAFMNDTALRADLILPPTLMLEQEDIIGSYLHRYVQYARAVIPAPEMARDDWWIIRNVAKRLAPPVELPDAETCLEMALETETLGCSLDDLRKRGCVAASVPAVAYADRIFDHHDGRYRFPGQLHPEPAGPEGYPLRLLSLVRRGAIHSQILEKDQKQPPTVWVSPDCPWLERIDLEKPLKLVSPVGSIKVELKQMTGLYSNAVLYRRGDWYKCGGGVNQLIAAETTDIGKGAAFYQQYVRLENF